MPNVDFTFIMPRIYLFINIFAALFCRILAFRPPPEMHHRTVLAENLLQTGYEDLPEREQRLAHRVAAFGSSWTFIILAPGYLPFAAMVPPAPSASGRQGPPGDK